MEMREPIGTLSVVISQMMPNPPTFWIHSLNQKIPQKNISLLLQENFKSPRHSRPIASDVKTRTSLSAETLQARDNNDPNKGSEYEIRKHMEDSLSYWVKSSKIGPC